MKQIINKKHPAWIAYWASRDTFINLASAIESGYPAWLEGTFEEWENDPITIFKESHGDDAYYAIPNTKDGFVSIDFDDYVLFSNLEDAAEYAYCVYYTECMDDWEFNEDETQIIVDGQWLIKEVQE